MRNIVFMVFALAVLLEPLFAQTPDSYSYQILYTGRTLGYARYPDQQTLPWKEDKPSKIGQDFLDQFQLATKPGVAQLRIAMGDNFSPELFGRSITVDSSIQVHSCDGNPIGFYTSGIHLPKDYFNWENGGWYIWCRPNRQDELVHAPFSDNVADFLIKAQYDTVVPGKHDFYFGPQYLRQIADYLGKKGVQMLGENMIVTSSLAPSPMNAYPRIPERLAQPCHFNTGKDHECYHTDFGPASLDLPDNVLPWKRQFVLHGARAAFRPGSKDLYGKDDLSNGKDDPSNVKDAAIEYHQVFDAASVQICAEPGPATNGDPAKVLRRGEPCFKLIASDEVCKEKMRPQFPHLIPTCMALYLKTDGFYKEDQQAGSTDITFLFRNPGEHLKAGLNHMFCVNPRQEFKDLFGDATVPICQAFPVQIPLFWSDPNNEQPASGMASCGKDQSVQCPYALVTRGDFKAAVFAVVDPDLLSNVGMLNTGWLNIRNKRWDTLVQITAPDYALLQTLEFCNANEECRSAPKILMAQMSYARAKQLLSNSSFSSVFDVVLTQASPEHDTGAIDANYQGNTPRFALTPPDPMSPDPISIPGPPKRTITAVMPQVYVATVTKEQFNSATARQTCRPSPPKPGDLPCWTVSNVTARRELPTSKAVATTLPTPSPTLPTRPIKPICGSKEHDCNSLETLAKHYLKREKAPDTAQAQPLTNPAASDPVTQAVLLAMRNALKTDAAMVQTRDLYNPDNLVQETVFNPETKRDELQDQVSRVVWKGDEAIVLHVTGATIRKLLKQSTTFAQLDKNSLNTEIEKGRDLITLGIYPDPKDSDTYYINGAAMVDTTLYTIAATDFISGGDTGYANLVPPDVLPAFRVREFAQKKVKPIAGFVCKALAPTPALAATLCAQMELGPDYFDSSQQPPFDATPGYSTPQHWRSFARNFRMPRRPFLDTEQVVQQRPFWALKLENLDFSESGVFINHFRATTQGLAGISNPLIANKGSQNIGADDKVRLIYDYRKGTAYVLSDLSFLYNATTSAPPTLAYNVLGFEAGGTLRLPVPRYERGFSNNTSPALQRPSWLSVQYSIRYERELIPPFDTQITGLMPVGTETPSVSNLTLHTPVVSTIYGRFGLRAESSDTYLETGVEQIDARGLLKNYTIPQTVGSPYNCFPVVSSADLQCVTSQAPGSPVDIKNLMIAGPQTLAASPTTTAYLTPGAYVNFNWKFPIWSRRDANRADQSFYFTLTNKGDVYFNTSHDTPVQTRYLDKLTPTLSFPIWAGLSLTPKVDFILYENKINGFHYRTVQPSASLSYTFSWRQGTDWVRALKYGAQTTTPSPAGSTR